ncbi:MAG TPA: PDZ domain-containing protein, partial [Thermoanaerobaculia bacterium]
MSARARIVLAVSVTVLLVAMIAATIVNRIGHWQERGIAGLSYVEMRSGSPGPAVFGAKPGQVMMTYPRGAAQRAGIKPHDDILSINGITLTEREKLFALDESLRAGQPVTYRLRRNGTEFEKVIPLESPWPHPLMALAVTVAGTVSVAFVVIGLFVFSRAPMDRRSVVFHAMTTIGALSILAGALLAVDVGAMRGIVALPNFGPILLVAALSLLFVPLTLHLALVFPKDRPLLQRNPHLLRWVYGAPFASMLLAGLFFAMVALVLRNPNDEPKLVGKILDWVSGIVAVGGLLIALRIARRGREEGIRWAFWRRPIQSLVVLFAVFMSIARVAAALKIKWLAVASVLLTIGVVPLAVFFAYPVLSCILLWRSYRESGP